eukprot:UN25162
MKNVLLLQSENKTSKQPVDAHNFQISLIVTPRISTTKSTFFYKKTN